MEKYDIVYLVKDKPINEELRYSLRSVEQNLPHRHVFLFGGCPTFVDKKKVKHKYIPQGKHSKWDNTSDLLKQVCLDKDVSENFILFNDDFFVMRPIKQMVTYHDRTLAERIDDFSKKYPTSRYVQRLKVARQTLGLHGVSNPLNFELHTPMLFNKEKLLEVYREYSEVGAKRTIYGNLFVETTPQMSDVKHYNAYTTPEQGIAYCSTTDMSFAIGLVGKLLRSKFNEPCKYEKEEEWTKKNLSLRWKN